MESQATPPRVADVPMHLLLALFCQTSQQLDTGGLGTKGSRLEGGGEEEPVRIWGRFLRLKNAL